MSATPKHQITGGDDLDDGLELDPDLLAGSGSEDGDGSINGEDLLEMTDEEDKGPRVTGQKRKASEDDLNHGQDDAEASKADKKKRRKEKEKERRAKRMANNPTAITSTVAATHLTIDQLSQMFLASIRETFPASTPMEIEDMTIPNENLLAPPDTPAPSFEHDPFNPLSLRLKALLKPFQSKKPPVQTPRVIILSLSGMRCADVVRAVKPFKGQGEVAKLFAKHFKLEEQVKYLAKTRVSIAVGTPARVSKLLTEGALTITSNTIVLLDVTYKDPKQRSLLTLPEIRKELWQSIFSGEARQKLLGGGAKIGAF